MAKQKQKKGSKPVFIPTKALIIADSFEPALEPLAASLPPILYPVCDVPAIEYMLDHLAANGFSTIYIASTRCTPVLLNYLAHSVWAAAGAPAPATVHVLDLSSDRVASYGDALRAVRGRGVLDETFLLLDGALITNAPLGPYLTAHAEYKAARPNSLATVVLRNAERALTTTLPQDTPEYVALAGARIVAYAQPAATPASWVPGPHCSSNHGHLVFATRCASSPFVSLPLHALRMAGSLTVLPDAAPGHIAVVEPGLLDWAADNFDVHTHAALMSSVLTAGALHGHELGAVWAPETALTVSIDSWRTYAYVNTAVQRRAAFPYTPEANALTTVAGAPGLAAPTAFVRRGGNVVAAAGAAPARIERGVVLGRAGTLVGAGAVVQAGAQVSGVVGAGCIVEAGAVLNNCIVWPGARIGAGAVLHDCIVCAVGPSLSGGAPFLDAGAAVADGAVLPRGSVVLPGSEVTAAAAAASDESQYAFFGQSSAADASALVAGLPEGVEAGPLSLPLATSALKTRTLRTGDWLFAGAEGAVQTGGAASGEAGAGSGPGLGPSAELSDEGELSSDSDSLLGLDSESDSLLGLGSDSDFSDEESDEEDSLIAQAKREQKERAAAAAAAASEAAEAAAATSVTAAALAALTSADGTGAGPVPASTRTGAPTGALADAVEVAVPLVPVAAAATNAVLPRGAWISAAPTARLTRDVPAAPYADALAAADAAAGATEAAGAASDAEDARVAALVSVLATICTRCVYAGETSVPTMLTEVRTTAAAHNADISLGVAFFRAMIAAAVAHAATEMGVASAFLAAAQHKSGGEGMTEAFEGMRERFIDEEVSGGLSPADAAETWQMELLYATQDALAAAELGAAAAQNLVYVIVDKLGWVDLDCLAAWWEELVEGAEEEDDENDAATLKLLVPLFETLCGSEDEYSEDEYSVSEYSSGYSDKTGSYSYESDE